MFSEYWRGRHMFARQGIGGLARLDSGLHFPDILENENAGAKSMSCTMPLMSHRKDLLKRDMSWPSDKRHSLAERTAIPTAVRQHLGRLRKLYSPHD